MGYYQASERLDDTVLAPVGEKVAGKIKAKFDDAIAFVVCGVSVPLISTLFHRILTKIDGRKLGSAEAALIVGSIVKYGLAFTVVVAICCRTFDK